MNNLLVWFLEKTKMGTVVKKLQDFLDGKKQMLGSLAAAVPATIMIINKFAEQGMSYLMSVSHQPEFTAASIGWVGFFNALKGEKIRNEIAEIKDNVQPTA